MVTHSDKEYQLTKLIKQGKASMSEEFKLLAALIDRTFNVKTLNIIYDVLEYDKKPRIQVIFEYRDDEQKFIDWPFNYNPEKQKAIAEMFTELIQEKGLAKRIKLFSFLSTDNYKYQTKDIFVCYGAFAPIAVEETYGKISSEQLEALRVKLGDKNIWKIITGFGTGIIFFYTNEQAEDCKQNGIIARLSDCFFDIVKPYDEFNYIKKEGFTVSVDSKENFDKNYESNWYYYFK